MKEFLIQTDDGADVKFMGEEIAHVSSKDPYGKPRWTELFLYRTEGGNYVCESRGVSSLDDEVTRIKAKSSPDEAGVKAFFDETWLAKCLYDEMGWEFVEVVA